MAAGLCLSGCLPGEDDVAKKYNNINQRTAIENTALSLMQAANDMSAYLVAGNLVRRAPLSDLGITALATVSDEDNPKPNAPLGIKVATCSLVPGDDLPDDHSLRKLSAVAYFTAQPIGVPSLETTAPTMIRALAQRYGGESVGLVDGKGVPQYPKVADDADCMPNLTDAIPFSPIFAAGFKYEGAIGTLIPDSKKTTWPSVYRDITIPCPSPYQGVVKRKQHCRLITDENSTTPEEGVIDLARKKFGGKSENTLKRIEKTWECDPQDGQQLAPSAAEIDDYCRDPNAGLSQQAENTIQLGADNIKELLNTGASQYYTFKCRRNANGTNNCDTKPFNPNTNIPSTTFLRCDPQPVPEQYVINPIVPMQVDANGKVISETPNATKTGAIVGNRSCGQGWTGDLIAGYQVRACRLIKVVNGVQTPMKLAQTVYKIGYVGARCTAPPKEGTYKCPHPYDGNVLLRESNYMTKPLALQLGTAPAGEWSPSTIPWSRLGGLTGSATAETRARAAAEGYKISRDPLQGVVNPRFSSLLEGNMQPDMQKDVTGCKLADQTCEFPPDPINLGIIFDRSGSMDPAQMNPKGTDNPPLDSATNRMECQADLGDIFTDREAACGLLRDNARGEYPSDGRLIEAVLGEYLIDRTSQVFNNMMYHAVQNAQECSESMTDRIGICKPGGAASQGSCLPGRCVSVGGITGGTYIQVADHQLRTAIGYASPGSEVWYTEFNSINDDVVTNDYHLCNTVTDPNCDFVGKLNEMRTEIMRNEGKAKSSGTPLMKATFQALQQFQDKTKPGVLLYFTDGSQTDGAALNGFSNYHYPYGSMCESVTPASDLNSPDQDAFCRGLGIEQGSTIDESEVLAKLQTYYREEECNDPGKAAGSVICSNIDNYYDAGNDKLIGSPGNPQEWERCLSVTTVTLPSAIQYIKAEYPNLKVFILDLSGGQLGGCRQDIEEGRIELIDARNETGYQDAFGRAFPKSARAADPEDVCTRMRAGLYPNAVSY